MIAEHLAQGGLKKMSGGVVSHNGFSEICVKRSINAVANGDDTVCNNALMEIN